MVGALWEERRKQLTQAGGKNKTSYESRNRHLAAPNLSVYSSTDSAPLRGMRMEPEQTGGCCHRRVSIATSAGRVQPSTLSDRRWAAPEIRAPPPAKAVVEDVFRRFA